MLFRWQHVKTANTWIALEESNIKCPVCQWDLRGLVLQRDLNLFSLHSFIFLLQMKRQLPTNSNDSIDDGIDNYDYNNENDCANFCPAAGVRLLQLQSTSPKSNLWGPHKSLWLWRIWVTVLYTFVCLGNWDKGKWRLKVSWLYNAWGKRERKREMVKFMTSCWSSWQAGIKGQSNKISQKSSWGHFDLGEWFNICLVPLGL